MRLIECFDLLGAIIDLTQKKGQYLEEYKSLNLTCNILLETLKNLDNQDDFSSNLLLSLKGELLEAKLLLETSDPAPSYNIRGVNHILPGSRLDKIKEKNAKLDRFSSLLTLSFLSLINRQIQDSVNKKQKPKATAPHTGASHNLKDPRRPRETPNTGSGHDTRKREEFNIPKPRKKSQKLFKIKARDKHVAENGNSSEDDVKEIKGKEISSLPEHNAFTAPPKHNSAYSNRSSEQASNNPFFANLLGESLFSSIKTVASQIIECPSELRKPGLANPRIKLKVCGDDSVIKKFKEMKESEEIVIEWPEAAVNEGDPLGPGCRKLHSVSRKNFLFLKYADMISREHITLYAECSREGSSKAPSEMFKTCSQELRAYDCDAFPHEFPPAFDKQKSKDFKFFAVSSSCNPPHLLKSSFNFFLGDKVGDELKQTQEEDSFQLYSQSSLGKREEAKWQKMEKGERYYLDEGDVLGIIMDWPEHRKLIFGLSFHIINC